MIGTAYGLQIIKLKNRYNKGLTDRVSSARFSARFSFKGIFDMKTTLPKDPGDNRDWFLVDAKDKILGRLAVDIANALRGKNKPSFTSHIDMGSFVVVVNADKVKLTG